MRASGSRLLIGLLSVALCLCWAPVARAITLPHRYVIDGRGYYGASITAARYLPGLPVQVKAALDLVSKCPNLTGNVFVSFSQVSGGVVAYAPTSLLNCRSVVGGGPGGFSPCYSFFPTTDAKFPYAFVAGTSTQTCIDLAFEVPGGVPVTLSTNSGPRPFLIKAQHYQNGSLVDFVASPAAAIPSSRETYAFWDSTIGVGRRSTIPLF